MFIWVRSRNCGCLVTWFCYQLIAKPGNKTAAVSWPDPYFPLYQSDHNKFLNISSRLCGLNIHAKLWLAESSLFYTDDNFYHAYNSIKISLVGLALGKIDVSIMSHILGWIMIYIYIYIYDSEYGHARLDNNIITHSNRRSILTNS